jgi:hypothetical protein
MLWDRICSREAVIGYVTPVLRTQLLLQALLAGLLQGQSTTIELDRLGSTRLPYDELVGIRVTAPTLKKHLPDLDDWLELKTVEAIYSSTADKTERRALGTLEDSSAKAKSWKLIVGPFKESDQVQLQIVAKGPIKSERLAQLLINDERVGGLLDSFFSEARGKSSDEVDRLLETYGRRLAEIVEKTLPAGISISGEKAGDLLRRAFQKPATINLMARYNDALWLRNDSWQERLRKLPQPTPLAVKTLIEQLQKQIEQLEDDELKRLLSSPESVLYRFKADYDEMQKALSEIDLQSAFDLAGSVFEAATVEYLQKYAAVDVASLWIPRLNEMRAFAVLNLYWGPVGLVPPKLSDGVRHWLLDRLSLAFGYSLKNISSTHATKIRGNNVWIYGIGFRFNRYFRISAGGALYRGVAPDSGLRNDFIVGPSLDITAMEYFRTIFAKIKR